jgi:hypothetical protein
MDDKIFVYLQLRVGDRVVSRTKIREFAGLGSLMAEMLRKTAGTGIEIEMPHDESAQGESTPVLEYVDANTERILIGYRVDPVRRVQVIEGCIPPAYQHRMLNPDSASVSLDRFTECATEGLSEAQRSDLTDSLAGSQVNIIERIREVIDSEGNFLVHVPLRR